MMKKISTLALGLTISLAGTAFAANPFALVPTTNWEYDSIATLVNTGAYEGYRDINFDKEQALTRYEMATLVAKAMANESKATAEQKVIIDKLATEFKTELGNLGVYTEATTPVAAVSTPSATPSTSNPIDFSGFYRLRYQTLKDKENSANSWHVFQYKLELDATKKLANDWTANFSWEAAKSFYNEKGLSNGTNTGDISMANIAGPLAGTTATIGKFSDTIGSGLIFDDELSGAKFEFGKKLHTKILYADADKNIADCTFPNSYLSSLNTVAALSLSYDLSKATTFLTSYQHWNSKDDNIDSMNVYDFNLKSKLTDTLSLYATYDKTSYDNDNRAWVAGFSYKEANQANPGSFGAWIDYERFEKNTAIDTTYWVNDGTKGVALGFSYVPFKDVKWTNTFFSAKTLPANNLGVNGTNEAAGVRQNFFRSQVYYFF